MMKSLFRQGFELRIDRAGAKKFLNLLRFVTAVVALARRFAIHCNVRGACLTLAARFRMRKPFSP
jgi:hypothetical protein